MIRTNFRFVETSKPLWHACAVALVLAILNSHYDLTQMLIDRGADVVGVLTGNVLKDPDYIYKYHTGKLEAPGGVKIRSTYGNQSIVVPNDPDRIVALLQ